MANQKQNDWIVAGINNQNYTPDNFRGMGMSLDNTLLLSKEDYMKSDYIKNNDLFKDDSGKFSEKKFTDFYNQKVLDFENFKTVDDTFYYDMFDATRMKDPKGKVAATGFNLYKTDNPLQKTIGVSGINQVENSPLSVRELALLSKIYDSESGTFKDYSPNDHALTNNPINWLKDLFAEPLVLALYDKDFDEVTKSGEVVHHAKGDYKLNDEGQYYYETLNGRSSANKLVLSTFDTLTVDGEGINKYDFFDSDDLDKSLGGTIMKGAVAIAPMLISGPIGTIYSGLLVVRELSKTLPMIDGLIGGITGNNNDTFLTKAFNNLAGYGNKFTESLDDESSKSMFSEGNLANLLVDVALQWGQLKVVALAVQKLSGLSKATSEAEKSAFNLYKLLKPLQIESLKAQGLTDDIINGIIGTEDKWKESALGASILKDQMKNVEKYADKINRLGADISLAYMSAVSNPDVYLTMLDHGCSKREAIAVTLGSTLGMYTVDKKAGIGELFFDELTADSKKALRAGIKAKAELWATEFKGIAEKKGLSGPQKLKALVSSAKEKTTNWLKQYADDLVNHTTNAFGKALGEGLEEVSEELVSDMSKLLYEWAHDLGLPTTTDNVEAFDNVWDDPSKWGTLLSRYGSNFLGGVAGGGLFYGVDVFKNGKYNRDKTLDELIYLVRNNKTLDVLNLLDKYHKNGNLGSTSLSVDFETVDGDKHFLTADGEHQSQNDFVYLRLKEEILSIDGIIKEHSLNVSEDDMYQLMTFDERRFQLLEKQLKDQSYQTGYQERYHNLISDIVQKELEIKGAKNSGTDSERKENEKDISKLELERDELLLQLEDFKSGKTSIDYMGEMTFLMDPRLNSAFFNATFPQWLLDKHDVLDMTKLTEEELEKYRTEYLELKESHYKRDAHAAWEGFKAFRKQIMPELTGIEESSREYSKWMESAYKIFDAENGPFATMKLFNMDSLLEGETEDSDSYKYRMTPLENEDDESFKLRIKERLLQIDRMNQQEQDRVFSEVNKILDGVGGFIDTTAKRRILTNLQTRKEDIVKEYLQMIDPGKFKGSTPALSKRLNTLFSELKADLSNLEDLHRAAKQIIHEEFFKDAEEDLGKRIKLLSDLGHLQKLSSEEFNLLGSKLSKKMAEEGIDLTIPSSERDAFLREMLQKKGYSSNEIDNLLENVFNIVDTGGHLDYDAINSILNDTGFDVTIKDHLTEVNNITTSPLFKQLEQELINGLDAKINYIQSNIDNDRVYLFIKTTESRSEKRNPIIEIVKKLALASNKDITGIEPLLQKLSERLLHDLTIAIDDFLLTNEERDALDEAEILLKLARAFIYACYDSENFENPFGHNKLLNDVAKRNNVEDWLELPIIGDDVANLYISQIEGYLHEIGQLEGDHWTEGSWRYWDAINSANIAQKFLNTDKRFAKAKLQLFTINQDLFVSNEGSNISFNLLKGIESIEFGDDEQVTVFQIENLFYKNILEIMHNNNLTFKLVLELSKLIGLLGSKEDLLSLKTSLLNLDITYDRLTSMDKFMYIIGIAATSSVDVLNLCKQLMDSDTSLAPLTSLEHDIRLCMALASKSKYKGVPNGLEIYTLGIEWLFDICKSENKNPLLAKNLITLLGNGGAGKTSICIRTIAEMFKKDKDSLWVSGPESTLVAGLEKVTGSENSFTKDELFNKLLGESVWKEIKSVQEEIKQNPETTVTSKYFLKYSTDSIDNTYCAINIKADPKITFPKLLVIDEASHFSNYELSIILTIAEEKGFGVILVGDEYLNGYSNDKLGNLEPDLIFCGRTNRLSLTLRTANTLKFKNTAILADWIRKASLIGNGNSSSLTEQRNKLILEFLHINLSYYNGSVINGDYVTDSLKSEDIDKLSGDIAYVGSLSSDTYRNLCAKFGEDKIKHYEEAEIQGLEFDYIVIDKDWGLLWNDIKSNTFNNDPTAMASYQIYKIFELAKSIYTLSTRGKSAAIFIDNGLSNIIHFSQDSIKATVNTLSKDTITNFRNLKEKFISKISLDEITLDLIDTKKSLDDGNTNNEPTPDDKKEDTSDTELNEAKKLVNWKPGDLISYYTSNNVLQDKLKFNEIKRNETIIGKPIEVHFITSTGKDLNFSLEEFKNLLNNSLLIFGISAPEESEPKINIHNMSELNPDTLDFNKNTYLVYITSKEFFVKIANSGIHSDDLSTSVKTVSKDELTTLMSDKDLLDGFALIEVPKSEFGESIDTVLAQLETIGTKNYIPNKYIIGIFLQTKLEIPPETINPSTGEEELKLLEIHDLEDLQEANIGVGLNFKTNAARCYGESHLLGCPKTQNEDKSYTWNMGNLDDDILYDCLAMITDDEEGGDISDGTRKNTLVKRLLLLKSLLFYDVPVNSDSVPREIREIIGSGEDLKDKITYKVVVEKQNPDRDSFVGYSGLDEEKMEIAGIDGDKFTYKVVAEWKAKRRGKNITRRITLGLLADPKKYKDSDNQTKIKKALEGLRNDLLKKLDEHIITDPEEYKQIQTGIENITKQIDTLKESADNYELDLTDMAEEAKKLDGVAEFELSKDSILYLGNTEIRHIYQNEKTIPKRRLVSVYETTRTNIDGITTVTPEESWFKSNPYAVYSPVYGYRTSTGGTGTGLLFGENGLSIGGKCVIFVSRNMLLKPSELVDVWKLERGTNHHSVRMIILDNVGTDFRQLTQDSNIDEFKTKSRLGSVNYLPYETKIMAYRLLVAMWNFRANLLNFLDLLNKAFGPKGSFTKVGLTTNNIDDVLSRLSALWNEYVETVPENDIPTEDKFEKYVTEKGTGLNKALANAIFKFNKGLSKSVKQFRLGVSSKHDYIIRRLNNLKESDLYSKDLDFNKVYGLYTSYKYSLKLLTLIESLFNIFIDPFFGKEGLNLVKTDNPNVEFRKRELIEVDKKGKINGKIPNILNLESPSSVTVDGKTIILPETGSIRYLPSILILLYKDAVAYQTMKNAGLNPDEKWNWENALKKFAYKRPGDEDLTYFGIENDKNLIKELIQLGDSIQDFLELMFFGTTEDFIDARISGNPVPLCEDAYFKYGFLTDPLMELNNDANEIDVQMNGYTVGTLVPIQTSLTLFAIRGALDMSHLNIDLSNKVKIDPTQEILNKEEIHVERSGEYIRSDQHFNDIARKQELPDMDQDMLSQFLDPLGISLRQKLSEELGIPENKINYNNLKFELVNPGYNIIFTYNYTDDKNYIHNYNGIIKMNYTDKDFSVELTKSEKLDPESPEVNVKKLGQFLDTLGLNPDIFEELKDINTREKLNGKNKQEILEEMQTYILDNYPDESMDILAKWSELKC